MIAWVFRRPTLLRRVMSLWPPFLFSGIVVEEISADYRYARTALKWRLWTRNINNSHYGGNLYSMTDPVYATLILGLLGREKYLVWDKGAEIDYVSPGHGKVYFEARVSDAFLEDILEYTKLGQKYTPWVEGYIVDKNGMVVAHIKRQLYIRLRRKYRPIIE